MNAYINIGKLPGDNNIAEVVQWCNDWFMLENADPYISQKTWSPTQLLFTHEGMTKIVSHKNNGMLFMWFEAIRVSPRVVGTEVFTYTFVKKRYGK